MDQSAAQQLSRLEEATVPHSGLGPEVHPGVNLLESLGFLQLFHLENIVIADRMTRHTADHSIYYNVSTDTDIQRLQVCVLPAGLWN